MTGTSARSRALGSDRAVLHGARSVAGRRCGSKVARVGFLLKRTPCLQFRVQRKAGFNAHSTPDRRLFGVSVQRERWRFLVETESQKTFSLQCSRAASGAGLRLQIPHGDRAPRRPHVPWHRALRAWRSPQPCAPATDSYQVLIPRCPMLLTARWPVQIAQCPGDPRASATSGRREVRANVDNRRRGPPLARGRLRKQSFNDSKTNCGPFIVQRSPSRRSIANGS